MSAFLLLSPLSCLALSALSLQTRSVQPPLGLGCRATTLRAAAESGSAPLAVLSWRESSDPEPVVPDVSLTRSRDGSTGTATFRFEDPQVLKLNDIWSNGLITGLWLRDAEGVLHTRDVDVSFERGRPRGMTAILVLKSSTEWERFMRFMRRFAESNSLEFESAG